MVVFRGNRMKIIILGESVSCQGTGASTWWPCKDHQSDEPDSMQITGLVRSSLQFISNGNLRNQKEYFSEVLNSNIIESSWFVGYPYK